MQDERLQIQQILNGDRVALKQLIEDHQRLVFVLIARMVHNPEDQRELAQEVFVKVYQKLASFRFECKLSTWIAKIAVNLATNYCRKNKLQLFSDMGTDASSEMFEVVENNEFDKPADQSEQMEVTERDALIKKEVEALPDAYRMVLAMYHWQQFSYTEIAESLKMPEGTVKNYLFRARKLLKERLIKHNFIEEYLS